MTSMRPVLAPGFQSSGQLRRLRIIIASRSNRTCGHSGFWWLRLWRTVECHTLVSVVIQCYLFITLRTSCGTVYCNRSCLWVCVCGSVTMILEISYIDPRQTRFVRKGSDHLQLIKFWPSHVPGKGVCGRAKFLAPPSTASAQCLRLSEHFFSLAVICWTLSVLCHSSLHIASCSVTTQMICKAMLV